MRISLSKMFALAVCALLVSAGVSQAAVGRDGTCVHGSGTFNDPSYTTASLTFAANSIGVVAVVSDFDLATAGVAKLDSSSGTALTVVDHFDDMAGGHLYVFKTAALTAGAHTVYLTTDSGSIGGVFNVVWCGWSTAAVGNTAHGHCNMCGSSGNEFSVAVTAGDANAWIVGAFYNGWNNNVTPFMDGGTLPMGNVLAQEGNLLVYDSNGTVASGSHAVGQRQNVTDINNDGVVFTLEPSAAARRPRCDPFFFPGGCE